MILSSLLAAFIIMPIIELAVLLKLNEYAGLVNTIAIVIITGFVGAFLARAQGIMVLAQIRRDMVEGRMPAPRLMDGVMILIAGVLLITPGLITDTAGFILLIPAVRATVRAWLGRKLEGKLRGGTANIAFWRW